MELIKIKEEDGKQLVSARELYLGLGLNKTQWSRWYKSNILNNEFFTEGIDFIRARHYVEGNEIQDFAITLEFAKHIAMMARTEKSHQYRNYFIKCEKELKESVNTYPALSKELQAIFMLDNRTEKLQIEFNEHKEIVNKYIDNQELSMAESKRLTKLANKIIVSLSGGKQSAAYKKLNKKLFSDLYKQLHREFGITSIAEIKQKDIYIAREIINKYKPPIFLINEIDNINKQISFDEEKM